LGPPWREARRFFDDRQNEFSIGLQDLFFSAFLQRAEFLVGLEQPVPKGIFGFGPFAVEGV
jgi:hypothetical protein